MPRHIPFYPELLEQNATTNEILLYGLIEASAFSEGFCYASSDYMAKQLGLKQGTIKNLLVSLSKRGWISVETEGNKRIAITPLLGLAIKPKNEQKPNKKGCGKPCGKLTKSVTQELRYRHARMTLPSRRNDALNRGVTGNGIIMNNNIIKKEIIKKKEAGRSAGCRMASRLTHHKDFFTIKDYENEFYKLNTFYLGAG